MLVTPDRFVGQDLGAQNLPVYLDALLNRGGALQSHTTLLGLRRHGNRIAARVENRFSKRVTEEEFDAVVLDQGVVPDPTLFDSLAGHARNHGEFDYDALADGVAQPAGTNPDGAFALYRIGDAAMARNIHAAIYEARRLCVTI